MGNLLNVVDRCKRAVDEAMARLRARPTTAASRAYMIQGHQILRTLERWRTRTPYPEQPARLARMARELSAAVLGEEHPRTLELRDETTSQEIPAQTLTAGEPGAAQLYVCVACRRSEPASTRKCGECGGPLRAFDPSSIVDGRYVITGELGRGGMGVVSEAIDVFLERAVALKLVTTGPSLAGAALSTFRREATALAAIRNDHVVQVHAFGLHAGGCYLAMERVVGRDSERILAEHAQHGSMLPVPLAVTLLSRVAAGLAGVHEAGLLHRDVKPSNIVIEDGTGRPVLIDFGLALRRHATKNLSPADLAGTPLYLAPELIRTPSVAPSAAHWNASDIYALGCTAFRILSGQLPFAAGSVEDVLRHRLTQPPPRASSVRPGMEAFDEVLRRVLATDPEARPETAFGLAHGLQAALTVWLSREPTLTSRSDASSDPTLPATTTGDEDGPRVLVVDDDAVFRTLAARCATLAFFQCPARIETASSGEEAIASAALAMPDLVVLDYGMPGEDGVTTLTRLRALPGGDMPRVIVVSASVTQIEEWRFRALGVTDFVAKPIKFQPFVERIANVASRAGWQNAIFADSQRPPPS